MLLSQYNHKVQQERLADADRTVCRTGVSPLQPHRQHIFAGFCGSVDAVAASKSLCTDKWRAEMDPRKARVGAAYPDPPEMNSLMRE